jgi:hypothetical protein
VSAGLVAGAVRAPLSLHGGFGMLRAMSARPIVVFALGLGVCAGFGCAYGEVRQVVRAQFATELDCPEVFITKRDAWYQYESANQFKVTGCGVVRSYTCPVDDGRVSYDEPACTWVEGDADAPKMKPRDAEGNVIEESEEFDGAPIDDGADHVPAEPEDPFEDDEQPAPDEADDAADDAEDTSGGADAEGGGSTSVKPAGKKGGGASGQASGGFKIGTGKK